MKRGTKTFSFRRRRSDINCAAQTPGILYVSKHFYIYLLIR